jgi:hypothetical protein
MSPPPNGNGGPRQTAEPQNQKNASSIDNRPGSEGQAGTKEDRRNSAACFANPNKSEPWMADFVGVLVTEDLPAGTKCWVSVKKRLDKRGKVYVTVTLKARER